MHIDPENTHVLYLSRWYPNEDDPMPGLFVKYHAETATDLARISLLYVQPSSRKQLKKYRFHSSDENGVCTLRVYYRKVNTQIPLINQAQKAWRFFYAHYIGYRNIVKKKGRPDLIHVNILTRIGLIAFILKIFYGIPYVITEHWSRYLDYVGTYKGWLRKRFTELVVRRSAALSVVSRNLEKAMKKHGLHNKTSFILNNVVDTNRFIPAGNTIKNDVFTFIHVSCFEDRSKNISGIIDALSALYQQRQDFRCLMVGEGMDYGHLRQKAEELPHNRLFYFCGLLEGDDLIKTYQQADALLLFSNYENMPVVINEAFACGLPVLATDVGGISEHVDDEKGLLAKAGDKKDLQQKAACIIDHYQDFDKEGIRKYAEKQFSRQAVAGQLLEIYDSALKNEK